MVRTFQKNLFPKNDEQQWVQVHAAQQMMKTENTGKDPLPPLFADVESKKIIENMP